MTASIAELQEQLKCLDKEIDELSDAVTSTVSSLLYLKTPAAGISNEIITMGHNAQLKSLAIHMDVGNKFKDASELILSHSSKPNRILLTQMAKNSDELIRLHDEMKSTDAALELEQHRAKTQEYRQKKYQKQHEINALKQTLQTRKQDEMNSIDTLKECLEELRSHISQKEKELREVNICELADE